MSGKAQSTAVVPAPINPEHLLTLEDVAERLHRKPAWVKEKCRRRCANPLPVFNVGRHLLFDWVQVSEWIRTSPRPIHARHRRRKKQREEPAAKAA
jgi:hypothetical protein